MKSTTFLSTFSSFKNLTKKFFLHENGEKSFSYSLKRETKQRNKQQQNILMLTLSFCTNGIPFINSAIVCVVFQVNESINDCSLTPGHGNVRFFPATATNFLTGIFSTSETKNYKNTH